jgi:hypothetical protein
MKNIARELQEIVMVYTEKIRLIPEKEFSAKPLAYKWSKKETLGHLVDSAQNNLRRFICAQYEPQAPFVTYQQDFWVETNRYQYMQKEDVIALWALLNMRIGVIVETMPAENYRKECNTGDLHTLEWLAGDYVRHLKHHINQILPGSFDVIYK